jgi:flavin reductase (DIM6/NTAB) family NADH-FMN oxidoreductase RutF
MMADGSSMTPHSFAPSPETARDFRIALGRFATGVTLVSTMGPDGSPVGFVANSFSSLSLDPPLVLWSPAISSRRYPVFAAARHFAIHVLARDHADWPARFARDGAGFTGLDWHQTPEGVPVLPGALSRFDCIQHATHPGGDHLIIVGRVLRVTLEEGEPLVFAQGKYGGFAA